MRSSLRDSWVIFGRCAERRALQGGKKIRQMFASKVLYLDGDSQRKKYRCLLASDIVERSVKNLETADVTVKHSFELSKERRIMNRPRGMHAKHGVLARKEINNTMEAKNIFLSSSAWSSLVVIFIPKTIRRFCIDYRTLKGFMWVNRWLQPHIEKIFDKRSWA